MRTRRTIAVALLGATALSAGGVAIAASGDDDHSAALASKLDPQRPKNVILLVGDGMGDSEVTSARYYGKGAAGRLNMDALPFRGTRRRQPRARTSPSATARARPTRGSPARRRPRRQAGWGRWPSSRSTRASTSPSAVRSTPTRRRSTLRWPGRRPRRSSTTRCRRGTPCWGPTRPAARPTAAASSAPSSSSQA